MFFVEGINNQVVLIGSVGTWKEKFVDVRDLRRRKEVIGVVTYASKSECGLGAWLGYQGYGNTLVRQFSLIPKGTFNFDNIILICERTGYNGHKREFLSNEFAQMHTGECFALTGSSSELVFAICRKLGLDAWLCRYLNQDWQECVCEMDTATMIDKCFCRFDTRKGHRVSYYKKEA